MELVGEEKRIQALFSDVRLADEQTTPSFAGLWNRAQSKTIRPQRAFKLWSVAATALLVCSLISLAWWSKHWHRSPDVVATTSWGPETDPVKSVIENEEVNLLKPGPKGYSPGAKARSLKLAARREASLVAANRKATREANKIASWQSPTASLLESQSDELLKSLPQLNHSVDELKLFLPSQRNSRPN